MLHPYILVYIYMCVAFQKQLWLESFRFWARGGGGLHREERERACVYLYSMRMCFWWCVAMIVCWFVCLNYFSHSPSPPSHTKRLPLLSLGRWELTLCLALSHTDTYTCARTLKLILYHQCHKQSHGWTSSLSFSKLKTDSEMYSWDTHYQVSSAKLQSRRKWQMTNLENWTPS